MCKFSAEYIFNLDETRLSTIVQSPRVVTETILSGRFCRIRDDHNMCHSEC